MHATSKLYMKYWGDVSDSKKKDGIIHRAWASKAHEHEDDSEDNIQDGSEYETEEDSLFW